MSLYGQTLDWHGRGQLSGAKLVHGLLSVGTQEQPDPGHLVDDFQRTEQDKLCPCVCLRVRVRCWRGVKTIMCTSRDCQNSAYMYC